MIFRFWYEKFDPNLIIRSGVLELLKKYKVGICFASMRRNYNQELAKLGRIMNDYGLRFCLWPLLPDELGYWISTYNAENFIKELDIIFSWASKYDVKIDEIAIDLEIPINMYEKLGRIAGRNLFLRLKTMYVFGSRVYDNGVSALGEARDIIREYGSKTLVPVIDLFLELSEYSVEKLQRAFGNPVFDIEWDAFSPMIYNSMWHGYIGIPISVLRNRMYQLLIKEKKLFGAKAGASIGVLWIGKLGNEPMYTRPEDIAIDAAIAKAAGIKDITIYNLEGVIFRNNDERFVEYPIKAKPIIPKEGEIGYVGYKFFLNVIEKISNFVIR